MYLYLQIYTIKLITCVLFRYIRSILYTLNTKVDIIYINKQLYLIKIPLWWRKNYVNMSSV